MQVYILVHTEAGKLGTETVLRIPGRTAMLLLPGRSDLRGPPTTSLSYFQDEVYNSVARKDTACRLCEATCASEPILENLTSSIFLLVRLNMGGISSAMCQDEHVIMTFIQHTPLPYQSMPGSSWQFTVLSDRSLAGAEPVYSHRHCQILRSALTTMT